MTKSDFKGNIAEIYAQDQERRKRLKTLLSPVLEGQKRLGMASDAGDTEKLEFLITNETFKILVIGEFNVGKSTFINALIGEEALPAKAIPATAIINILKYGETKKAWLHFKDKEKRPLNIPVEKLSDYVLIKNKSGEDGAQAEIRDTPFSHAEIWWPLDLLKENKVEIIDSPGLNENKVREDITMGYLNKVDAVLFLMTAVRFGPAQTEIDGINTLKSAEHYDLFFVVNQWDMLRPRQQEEVKSKAISVLPGLTERKNGIYFVSALDALEGRTENNSELEQKSGFKDFETDLHQFLAQEKGTVKMLRSARELKRIIINALTKTIPGKIALMKMPLGELEGRYKKTSLKLKKLTDDKKEMLDFVKRQRTQIVSLAESRVKEFFYEMEGSLEGWANEYELKTKFSFDIRSQVEAAINALGEYLKRKLELAFEEWADKNLKRFLNDRVKSLESDLNRHAARFENELKDAHFTLSGIEFDSGNVVNDIGGGTPLQRLLAAAGGWFIGGIGAGAIGAVFGWKEMLKGLIPNVGAIIAAILIGIPVLPAMLIASVIYGAYAFNQIGTQIKVKAVEKFREGLKASSSEHAKKIADNIDTQLYQLQEALRAGMEIQIANIKELADTAQSDRQKKQSELDAKLDEIELFKTTLEQTVKDLEEFIKKIQQI